MPTTQTAPAAPPDDAQTSHVPMRANTVLNTLKQPVMLIAIVAPLCLTFYAATALTRGTVSWMYPVGAILAASLVNLGTTAGFHRMLTHQAFKAHPVVQYALLILGAIAGMGSPIKWAHDHIHHHSHSDTEHDIHSPHTPLFRGKPLAAFRQWTDAHIGWMFRHQSVPVSAKAREVTNTPAARFVDRTADLWLIASLVVPLCFGWNAFLWFGAARLFLSHHITWSVNSICHLWGKQPFPNTKDKSRNNALVGILAMGEGWHNNHHFRPTSARHGLLRGQLDLTYALICLLERCKLVWDVQRYAPCPNCQDWRPLKAGKAVFCARCQQAA